MDRVALGRFGEDVACEFLVRQGVEILERNVRIGRGELDIVARDGVEKFVVEVKTLSDPGTDPLRTFTQAKQRQVRALARQHGCTRSDLVVVELHRRGVLIRWVPRQ